LRHFSNNCSHFKPPAEKHSSLQFCAEVNPEISEEFLTAKPRKDLDYGSQEQYSLNQASEITYSEPRRASISAQSGEIPKKPLLAQSAIPRTNNTFGAAKLRQLCPDFFSTRSERELGEWEETCRAYGSKAYEPKDQNLIPDSAEVGGQTEPESQNATNSNANSLAKPRQDSDDSDSFEGTDESEDN